MEEMEVTGLEPAEEVGGEIDERSDSGPRFGIGLGMLIGSGLTLAAIAGGKKLKMLWTDHRDKKLEESEVVDAEIVESSGEDEAEVSEDDGTEED